MAVGLGGLGLIVGARMGDTREDSVTVDTAAEVAGMDESVVTEGLAPAAEGPGVPTDQLASVVNDRALRLMNFRELEQSPEVCGEGISEEVSSTLSSIALSEGESGTIDEENLTELFVGEDVAYGDISGNGVDEAIVHALCTYGANAREHNLQVWDVGGGVADIVATVPEPGEDVTGPFPPDVRSFGVEDGSLVVSWSRHQGDDPHCCPSGEAEVRYRMIGGEIVPLGDPELSEAS